MGTRSLTRIMDDGKEICCIYRQFDGYPSGHGAALAAILAGTQIVNGMSGDYSKIHNGMGCLAASVIAKLKDGPGGIYLYAPGSKDCGEEYTYTITGAVGGEPQIAVDDEGYDANDKALGPWQGSASEALARWVEK